MPLLEVLVLKDCLPDDIPLLIPHDHPIIRLEHLHILSLDAATFRCANLISYLDFPSNVSIDLSGNSSVTSDNVCLSQYQSRRWDTLYARFTPLNILYCKITRRL